MPARLFWRDVLGVKLRKEVRDRSETTTTDYFDASTPLSTGGFIYLDEKLDFFPHSEGYVKVIPGGNYYEFQYVFQYKDHLGNIRLSYSDTDGDGSIEPRAEIVEEHNYYPFGLQHKGYNNVINGAEHPYGFNGKEEQNELGLQWLDFGARNYDPALGRWMNLDPLAEQMRRHSPYNYAFDNPISFIDPDGMAPFWINNGDGTWTAEAGDGADRLAQQAGISVERAREILANTAKDNPQGNMGTYEDPEDRVLKSAVDEGDVVYVPETDVKQKTEISEWNESVTSEMKTEISDNESTIDKNNKDKDSITKSRDETKNKMELHDKSGLSRSEPGDPKIGIMSSGTVKQTVRELKVRRDNANINKLDKTNDSLKKENAKKKKEIERRDSLYGNNN